MKEEAGSRIEMKKRKKAEGRITSKGKLFQEEVLEMVRNKMELEREGRGQDGDREVEEEL